jgi:hypothetical protein
MRHLADHSPHRIAQQPGVGIQRDDKPDVLAALYLGQSWYRSRRAAGGSAR